MKKYILILVASLLHVSVICQDTQLVLDGAIVVGNTSESSPEPGTIRWTGTDFMGWNGEKWISLSTGTTYNGEVTDIDGNLYPTVVIGSQEWMTENLRTTKYCDGTTIPNITSGNEWGTVFTGAWCWLDNDSDNDFPLGKLYNWYAVNDPSELCPKGWHIPSDDDWNTLINVLGGDAFAGGPLKKVGFENWNIPNAGATGVSGFNGLGGGFRNNSGSFFLDDEFGFWWSTSQHNEFNAWYRNLNYQSANATRNFIDKKVGFSVRCIKG